MKKAHTCLPILLLLGIGAFAQRNYSYELQLKSNQNNVVESTLDVTSELDRFFLSADTLLLETDSTYTDRSIEFTIDGTESANMFIGLSSEHGNHALGFKLINSKAYLSIGEFVLQGPFQGELQDGSPILINNVLDAIVSCKVVCLGNEISFFINDALVHKSCLTFSGSDLFHQVTAQASVDITIALSLNEW